MRASIGGIVNLFAIAVFLIVLASFLLFNVSYAKAFRVKNKIITTYEQYEGNCGKNTNCYREIERFEKQFGYKITYELKQKEGTICYQELGYCATEKKYKKTIEGRKEVTAYKYTIRTEVYIRFPFIQDIFGIGKFGVDGETKEILKGF